MGIPKNPPSIMRWMATLGDMKACGTILVRMCSSPCAYEKREDLDELIGILGEGASLVDARPPCPRCTRRNHFMVTPGESTPLRPLLSRDRGPEPARPSDGWPPWPPASATKKAPAAGDGALASPEG